MEKLRRGRAPTISRGPQARSLAGKGAPSVAAGVSVAGCNLEIQAARRLALLRVTFGQRGADTLAVASFAVDLAASLDELGQIHIQRPSQLQQPVEGRTRFQRFDVAEPRPADSRHFGEPLLGDSLRDPGGTKRTADSFDGFAVGVGFHA